MVWTGRGVRVLVIEDSPDVVQTLTFCFRLCWPESTIIATDKGAEGVELVGREMPDFVVLARELPDRDAMDVLSEIRAFSEVPILVLSVKSNDLEQVRGLELGADDYMTKPFSALELLARVKAVLRRTHGGFTLDAAPPPFNAGSLTVNFATHEVFIEGRRVHLTPLEYKLLCRLVRSAGQVMSYRSLLRAVWGDGYDDGDVLKTYIYQLRGKLGSAAGLIVNIRGVGYRFVNHI